MTERFRALMDRGANDFALDEACLLIAGHARPGIDIERCLGELDRLALDAARVEAMARAVEAVVALEDPVGEVTERWHRPNGLSVRKVIASSDDPVDACLDFLARHPTDLVVLSVPEIVSDVRVEAVGEIKLEG